MHAKPYLYQPLAGPHQLGLLRTPQHAAAAAALQLALVLPAGRASQVLQQQQQWAPQFPGRQCLGLSQIAILQVDLTLPSLGHVLDRHVQLKQANESGMLTVKRMQP